MSTSVSDTPTSTRLFAAYGRPAGGQMSTSVSDTPTSTRLFAAYGRPAGGQMSTSAERGRSGLLWIDVDDGPHARPAQLGAPRVDQRAQRDRGVGRARGPGQERPALAPAQAV